MDAVVAFALKQRAFIAILLPFILIGGALGFKYLNIEAYPDPVPPLVDIVTQSTGQSAEEIERYITIPIEIQMAGIPHVTAVRTISLFGLSDVKVQFTYDFTYQQAEQWVINRLSQLPALIQQRYAADLTDEPDRRDLSLPCARAAGLLGDGPEDARGLGARATLQGRAGCHRRHGLGREDQDLRGHDRSAPPPAIRSVAVAGAAGAQQQQHQCRRPDRRTSAHSRRWCAASA